MTLRTSSDVTTRCTPGIFCAGLASIEMIRPCATVLRNIFACSMPGSRMGCVYSARPVTFARASMRGSDRPTWPPACGCPSAAVERLAQRAPDKHPHELALVRRGAPHVRDTFDLVGSSVAGALESLGVDCPAGKRLFRAFEAHRFLGCGAHDDARGFQY